MATNVTVEELALTTQELQQEARDAILGINTKIANAEKAVAGRYKNLYVDQSGGDDSSDGTEAAPFASLQVAINAMLTNSFANIFFASDHHFSEDVICYANHGKKLNFIGLNKSDGSKPRITSEAVEYGTSFSQMYGVKVDGLMPVSLGFSNFVIEMPAYSGSLTQHPGLSALAKASSQNYPSVINSKFEGCDFLADSSSFGALVGAGDGMTNISISSSCSWTAAMAGHFVGGVAANSDPRTLSKISSNLATL